MSYVMNIHLLTFEAAVIYFCNSLRWKMNSAFLLIA